MVVLRLLVFASLKMPNYINNHYQLLPPKETIGNTHIYIKFFSIERTKYLFSVDRLPLFCWCVITRHFRCSARTVFWLISSGSMLTLVCDCLSYIYSYLPLSEFHWGFLPCEDVGSIIGKVRERILHADVIAF